MSELQWVGIVLLGIDMAAVMMSGLAYLIVKTTTGEITISYWFSLVVYFTAGLLLLIFG